MDEKRACDTSMDETTLDSLPADEISLILQKCSFFTLARLALTNSKWATCVAPVMLTSWKEVGAAQLQVDAASRGDLDELAAVQLSLKRQQLEIVAREQEDLYEGDASSPKVLDVGRILQNAPQDPLQLQSYKAQYLTKEKPLLSVFAMHTEIRFPWNEDARLAPQTAYCRMAVATTLRLSHGDLYKTIVGWLQVENLDAVADFQILDLIGECIQHSLNRVDWTSAQLAELASNAIAATRFSNVFPEDQWSIMDAFFGNAYDWVQRRTDADDSWDARCLEAVRRLVPPFDTTNQRFWLEYLVAECRVEYGWGPYYEPYHGEYLAKQHSNALPVAAFAKLIEELTPFESEWWEDWEQRDSWLHENNMDADTNDCYETTRHVLNGWAEANLSTVSEDDHRQFCALLSGLGNKNEIVPCSMAMGWVRSALEAGDVEAAKRLTNVFIAPVAEGGSESEE